MTEPAENGAASAFDQDTDAITLLKKLQQQMIFLEKKLDLLISRQEDSAGQPTGDRSTSFKDQHFSKPPYRPRPYGPSQGGGFRGDRDRGPRRDRHAHGGDRPSGGGGFAGRPYGRPHRDDHRNGGGSGFGGPKKPFYRGRKDRD